MYKFVVTLGHGRITDTGADLAATAGNLLGMLDAYCSRAIIFLEGGKCSSRRFKQLAAGT